MANTAKHGEIESAMDYSEHERTYTAFLWLVKWGVIELLILMIAMAIGFFAGWGLVGGTLVFAVLTVAAVLLF